jgi:hypothetical protein
VRPEGVPMSDRREDLRRQFGTVWKMASDGLGTLREVVVRSSQTGRLRVDLALLAREKQQLLARMGAQLGRLIDDGAVEVPEALKQMWERVRDVDARMNMDAGRAHDNAYGAPRGYEPEAGGYGDEEEEDALLENEVDEHAEMAQEKRR